MAFNKFLFWDFQKLPYLQIVERTIGHPMALVEEGHLSHCAVKHMGKLY